MVEQSRPISTLTHKVLFPYEWRAGRAARVTSLTHHARQLREYLGKNGEQYTPVLPIHAAFRRRKSFLWKLFGFFR